MSEWWLIATAKATGTNYAIPLGPGETVSRSLGKDPIIVPIPGQDALGIDIAMTGNDTITIDSLFALPQTAYVGSVAWTWSTFDRYDTLFRICKKESKNYKFYLKKFEDTYTVGATSTESYRVVPKNLSMKIEPGQGDIRTINCVFEYIQDKA